MEINKLRSIIKEAVKEVHLKEIEAVAENAAMEARLAEYDKAIKACEDKIATAENLEEIQEFIDENKINEVRKRLKNLKKEKEKIEKAKAKKNNGKKVVTDEPTEEPAVEEGNYYNEAESDDAAHIDALENDMEDDAMNNEVALNESFLKMQKLAGVITEAQYNKKKSLIENQLNENTKYTELKPLEDILISKKYTFYKDDVGFSGKATYEKGDDEISLFKDYEVSDIVMGGKVLKQGGKFPVRILHLRNNKTIADKNYNSINDAKEYLDKL